MSQVYHSNARTNQHVRGIIQKSDLTNVELAQKYDVNVKTVTKHRNRDFLEDKSSSNRIIALFDFYDLLVLTVNYYWEFS